MVEKDVGMNAEMIEDMRKAIRILSHDLRNPLLNIQALVQETDTLVQDAKQNEQLGQHAILEELPEIIDLLKSSTNRMDDMILGVNDIYHCMFDPLERELVDMRAMFLRCFTKLKLADEGMDISYSGETVADADPLIVQRIVCEVLGNAKKALVAKADAESRDIMIHAALDDAFVDFRVEDQGCGLNENEIGSVFEPFFSGRSFTSGAGMGLTRAKMLVARHGGSMQIESSASGGTVLSFSLPKPLPIVR